FDSLCWRLADTGKVTLCAPASIARWKPLRLGASATTFNPGIDKASFKTSAVSAIAGISFGGTKEPTSISRRPAAASARIQAFFASVGIRCLAFCSPSRGPTSQTWIWGMPNSNAGEFGVRVVIIRNCARSYRIITTLTPNSALVRADGKGGDEADEGEEQHHDERCDHAAS